MNQEELIEFLKESLHLRVKTESEYVGWSEEGGSIYKDHHKISLILHGETISETYL